MSDPVPRSWPARLVRAALLAVTGVLGASTLATCGTVAWLEAGPPVTPNREVRDVTQLVRIETERITTPSSVDELRALLAWHEGPVSIGGGRYSMGGQIGTDGTLFVDTRELDQVLALDVENRTIRVEAGITWREIIHAIDEHDLSVKIMQSYADFTVGGTLSVNAHGRYVNQGPVVGSVRAIELVLADGRLVRASRQVNPELFYGAIGGYGALGVIATVELDLAENVRVERAVERMPVTDFVRYFEEQVESSDDTVFFNADLYPPAFDDLVSITFSETERPVTVEERFQGHTPSTRTDRFMYWWVSEGPLGKEARAEVIDRMRLASKPVVWRNYEASYDVAGLEPASREKTTYVLQEYFIPVGHFDSFVPKMRDIFVRHDVNVVNVSIRHATPDVRRDGEVGTLLAWAPEECFAFVVYHKQGTSEAEQAAVGVWTREMNEAILEEHGTWYLPYQIHATDAQFHAAYPRAEELFALKREVDPDYTFRNRLLDRYLPPTAEYGGAPDQSDVRERLAARPTWRRPEDQTFLTLPEWSIVYSADELGAFLTDHRPSEFPYFAAIGQFWTMYRAVWSTTRERYDFNTGYHVMIGVIGVSYTVEYAAKGLYEHTVGWLFEGGGRTPEEDHYARVTTDYGAFTHHTPWYAFPFADRRAELGALEGSASLRGVERRVASTIELTAKSWWAGVIAFATGTAYDPQAAVVEAWVRPGDVDLADVEGVEVLEDLGGGNVLVSIPRYEPFTAAATQLAARGVEIVEVAGGERILVQLRADAAWDEADLWGDVLIAWPLLSDPTQQRIALEVPIRRLDEVLPALIDAGVAVEHLYDY